MTMFSEARVYDGLFANMFSYQQALKKVVCIK